MRAPFDRSSNRGMTIVEVLLVVVILAILAGIILPSVGIFKKKALVNSAKATLSLIHSAGMMYRSDEGAFPPGADVAVGAAHPLMVKDYLQSIPSTDWAFSTTGAAGPPPSFTVKATGIKAPVVGNVITTTDGATYVGP